ncbi:hypothetical protein OG216_30120 [Streptomycetaceae bacterium NBC_01309]
MSATAPGVEPSGPPLNLPAGPAGPQPTPPPPRVTLAGQAHDLDGMRVTVPDGWGVTAPDAYTLCLTPPGAADAGAGCDAVSVLRVYGIHGKSEEVLDWHVVTGNLDGAWTDLYRRTCAAGNVTATDVPVTAGDGQLHVRRWAVECADIGARTVVRWVHGEYTSGAVLHTADPGLVEQADRIVAAIDRTGYVPGK